MPGIPSKDASFVRETPRNYALTIFLCDLASKSVIFSRAVYILGVSRCCYIIMIIILSYSIYAHFCH